MSPTDLDLCRVKFSVKLDQISEKLSTKVQDAIRSIELTKLDKEFDFFVPQIYSAANLGNILKITPEIIAVTEELEEWISDNYSSFVNPKYGARLANHAVSYILRICPSYSVKEAKFRILCYYFIIGFIMDDWYDDNTKGEDDGYCSLELKKIQYFDLVSKEIGEMFEVKGFGGGTDEIDLNQLATKAMNTDMIKEQPFLVAIANSFEDIYAQSLEINDSMTLGTFWAPFKIDFLLTSESVRWSFTNARMGKLDSFCVDTYRYFKTKEAGFGNFINIITILESINLPQIIKCNPVFVRWLDMAEKFVGTMNDLLGLQKDLLYGEEDGIIMFKLRKGTSLNDAVDEELKLIGDYVKDYGELRTFILTEFGEKYVQVETFVDFVDSALHGSLYTFRDSIKYGMKDQIRVDYN